MSRLGLLAAAGLACALALPATAGAATGSTIPVGATQTTLAFCPAGAPDVTNPGSTMPSGCAGGTSVTLCKDADVHAFVRTERMMDGKRPALAPLSGTVLVRLQSPTFGVNMNATTFADYGTALAALGPIPPGTYDASATLWAGTTTNPDGTTADYPSSSASMSLTVTDSPCSGTNGSTSQPSTKTPGAKSGCGLGDDNHDHEAKAGKACPTK